MPFSANSPEGPVTLIGVDPGTIEAMRARNRKERLYTAKCCGAPLSIRVAEGKAPHFVHQIVPPGCDGDKKETPEHRRLKYIIATTAHKTWEWDIETEAREVNAKTGKTLWQADVLALKPKVTVAFEVQLSNADYEHMKERQARYQASGVRGLWFVRTKKGFPQSKELPVFVVEAGERGDWVALSTRWDSADMWKHPEALEWVELPEFIEAALSKRLKWAPFFAVPTTLLDACIYCQPTGKCSKCQRTLVKAYSSRLAIAKAPSYPQFVWYCAMAPSLRTHWHGLVVDQVWRRVAPEADVSFRSANGACCWCKAPAPPSRVPDVGCRTLKARLTLADLPRPRFGTVERDWLLRWAVLEGP